MCSSESDRFCSSRCANQPRTQLAIALLKVTVRCVALEACNVLFAALSFNQRTRMEVFSAGLFDSDRRSLFTAAHSGSQPGVNVTAMCGFMTYRRLCLYLPLARAIWVAVMFELYRSGQSAADRSAAVASVTTTKTEPTTDPGIYTSRSEGL